MPSNAFSTTQPSLRRKRELKTIEVMISLYCRVHHAGNGSSSCSSCLGLFDYATRRLERCTFGEAKPTCAKCTVHCYSATRREQIRTVMRWAGPRMLLKHPLLAMFHLIDGHRPTPSLPAKPVLHRAQATPPKRAPRCEPDWPGQ